MTTDENESSYDFWRGRNVLVTGGNGFLGVAVVSAVRERGAERVTIPSSRMYDLTRPASTAELFRDHDQFDIVIHLAANVGGIGANRKNPATFFYDNIMIGVNTMHAAWAYGAQKFVGIGTVCSYPKFAKVPFRETELWDGYPEETNAPYGLAKKMLLVMGQAYRQQYGFNAIHLIPTNLYGPGDDTNLQTSHVIPAMIRKCYDANERGDKAITLWGDGSPTREFLYKFDAVKGIIRAAEKYNEPAPVNLGSGREISMASLAAMVAKQCEFTGQIIWDTDKPNGQPRRKLDTSLALSAFGWCARTTLEEGIRQTVQFYNGRR